MNVLLDPQFNYPDLVAVAKALVAGTIPLVEACAQARKVTGGEIRETSVGSALVIGPQRGAEKRLSELQAYSIAQDQRTAEKWAAFVLMVEAQLGVGNLDPDASSLGLSNALRALEPCIRATGARCPPNAVQFAVRAIDSVLECPACTAEGLRAQLKFAKERFKECATSPGKEGAS